MRPENQLHSPRTSVHKGPGWLQGLQPPSPCPSQQEGVRGALTDLLRLPITAVSVSVAGTWPAVLRGWRGATRTTPWCSVLGTRHQTWGNGSGTLDSGHWRGLWDVACSGVSSDELSIAGETRTHSPHCLPLFPQGSTLRKRKMYEEFLSKVSILGQSERGRPQLPRPRCGAGGGHAHCSHTCMATHGCEHSHACVHGHMCTRARTHTAVSRPRAALALG